MAKAPLVQLMPRRRSQSDAGRKGLIDRLLGYAYNYKILKDNT